WTNPAQLNSTSTVPSSPASAETAAGSMTSRRRISSAPRAVALTSASFSRLTSVAMTLAPSAANASAEARPMPCAAAVTSAVLPLSRSAIPASLSCSAANCHGAVGTVNSPDLRRSAHAAARHPLEPGRQRRRRARGSAAEHRDCRGAGHLPQPYPGRAQARDPTDRQRRGGAQIRPDHRLCHDRHRPGEHVHTHNLAMGNFARDYAFCADARPLSPLPEAERATFQGIIRPDGRVATRNFLGILTSVNCSATAAKLIADQFRGGTLAEFPNVDGVIALGHGTGCGMASEGEAMDVLRRTIAGYARHPNFAGVLILGLGCEANQIGGLMAAEGLSTGPLLHAMTIQDTGGTAKTMREGVARLK